MTRLKARRLLSLSLVLVLVATYISVSFPTLALPANKYVWSRLETAKPWEFWKSKSELTAKSTALASHFRSWASEVFKPHAHLGSGYAKATVGTNVDEDSTGSFAWLINTGTLPKTPGATSKT